MTSYLFALLGAGLVLALWDLGRRFFEDRAAQRAHEHELKNEILADVAGMKDQLNLLNERHSVLEQTHKNFLTEMRDLVKAVVAARNDAQAKVINKGLYK